MAKALYTPFGILFAEEHGMIAVGVNAHRREHLANARRTRPGPARVLTITASLHRYMVFARWLGRLCILQ